MTPRVSILGQQFAVCLTLMAVDNEPFTMPNLHRITFAYPPAEAKIPIVSWFLKNLDLRLEENRANLLINDMKFGRAGLDVSWQLIGNVSEAFESELEEQFDWICRKASKIG
jgi:hypothetical protein